MNKEQREEEVIIIPRTQSNGESFYDVHRYNDPIVTFDTMKQAEDYLEMANKTYFEYDDVGNKIYMSPSQYSRDLIDRRNEMIINISIGMMLIFLGIIFIVYGG